MRVSTRLVLGAIGAAVGAFFGAPQLGYALGSAIGGAIDPEVIKGPSIGDIIDQTALEGGPRPFVYALSKPISGNIIAQGPPEVVKRRDSQGKGGPKVETESVYRTYAIGIGEGECEFVRIWRNGQLVYDITSNSLLASLDNARFLRNARFFTGTFDQLPSPDLETFLGVGTTPAHRGTCYMVMADEDLTDLRGAIPQWTFQVQRCPVQEAQLLAISAGGPDPQHQVLRSTDGVTFELVETPPNPSGPSVDFTWQGICHSPERSLFVAVQFETTHVMTSFDGVEWTLRDISPGVSVGGWVSVAWSPTVGLFCAVRANSVNAVMTSPDGLNWTLRSTPVEFEFCEVVRWNPYSELFVAGQNATGATNAIMTSPDGVTWTMRETDSSRVFAVAFHEQFCRALSRAFLELESSDGGVTWSGDTTGAPFGVGDLAFDLSGKCFAVSIFGGAISPTPHGSLSTVTMPTTGWEGVCYSQTFGGFYASANSGAASGIRIAKLADGSNLPVAINTPVSADEGEWNEIIAVDSSTSGICDWTLADVVTDICARASLPASLIDVSELESVTCRGFVVTNTYPAYAALKALSDVFFFDPADLNGIVKFVRRGANSVATFTENDFLDDEQDIEQSKRQDAIQIPRVLHVNYHDVAGGIATDKQTSERSGDRRATGEMSVQSAVIMRADEAAQLVAIHHKVMIEDQRGELKFCLPDSFIRLVPSNNVIVQWQQRSIRARIVKADVYDGYQEYVCLHDRQSTYTSNVEGIPAAPQTPPPSSAVGPTLIQPLDIHILKDADDNVGLLYYVAVSGVLQAWQGALVELSMDGGANYIESASTRISSVMGEIITGLGDHPAEFPDEVNTVTVRIDTPLAELTETDLPGMLNGLNLAIIGDELIQFATADEIVEGTWQISLLLRGRKGTQAVAHVAGERFVLLDTRTVSIVPASLSDIGRALTFRATSFGLAVETGTVITMTYTGRSQIEREPGYVMAHRDGTDLVVTWQGVGRLGSGATVAHGSRFAGYRVTFDDGAIEQVVDTDDQELTHDVTALGSPISIRVAQLNDLTGAGPYIEVIIT